MKRIDLRLGENTPKVRRLTKIIKRLVPIILVVAILISLAIFLTTSSTTTSVVNLILSGTNLKSTNGRVNVLLLGISGGTHAGSNLTDTIIVASYNLKNNKLHLISIPRDLWLPALQTKANAVYQIGKNKGEGIEFTKTIMGNVVGIPIHFGLRVDFRGFIQAIDILGGIDVEVERSFDDYYYPIEGKENDLCDGDKTYRCRYETISFTKGRTHMDGNTALKFVRSRHAEGEEGSDFARSKRQQLVMAAIKEKGIIIAKSLDLTKMRAIYKKANSLVNRDVTNQELTSIGKDILLSKTFIQKNVFLPEDLFIVPDFSQYDGKYVLIPAHDSFDVIYKYVHCFIEKANERECTSLIEERKEDE